MLICASSGEISAPEATPPRAVLVIQWSLDRAIAERYSVIAGGIGILAIALATGIFGIGSARMNFSFFPPIESDYVTASLIMPQGTPIEATERAARMLLDSAYATQAQMDDEGLNVDDESLVKHIMF